jgi:SAM-dependent methyltransferase
MSLAAKLDAIRSRPLRLLAKGMYYGLTLQLFEQLRRRRAAQPPRARARRLPDAPGGSTWLQLTPVRDRVQFEAEMAQPAWRERVALERRLAEAHRHEETFGLRGYSIPAQQEVDFRVDRLYGAQEIDGVTVPRWRERLVCPLTGLTNRQRAMLVFLVEAGRRVARNAGRPPALLLFEQLSPLYRFLRETEQDWNVVGCEWLGAEAAPGAVVRGVRHEDAAALSLAESSVDIVASLDVFEHVPDPRRGFAEKARVLRPGGVLLMTVPFFAARDATVRRARLQGGRLEYLLPAEYHGNPMDPAGGSLVYHDFGWDLLAMIREAGFRDAFAGLYWSERYGHLGAPQTVFVGTK